MVAAVIQPAIGVVIVPSLIVNRDPHLRRIAVIQAVGTSIVLVPVEILWVIYVRVMIEALPILGRIGLAPGAPIGLLGRGSLGLGQAAGKCPCAAKCECNPANHRIPPSIVVRVLRVPTAQLPRACLSLRF